MTNFSFRSLMITRSLGALCDQLLMFAVPLAILMVTNSASLSALSFVIEWIPRVIFFPIAGSLIDGRDLRKVFLLLDLTRIGMLILAFIALPFLGIFWTLSILMAFMSLCYVVNFVSIEAVIPNNLPPEDYSKAHSWVQAIEQISQVVGPALAVIIYYALGIKGIIFTSAVLLIISSLNVTRLNINYSADGAGKLKDTVKSNKLAFGILIKEPQILYLCGLTWVVNIVFGVALSITPAIITQTFSLPSSRLGLVQTVGAILSVLCFYLIPKISLKYGVTLIGQSSLAIILISGLILSLAPEYWSYAVGYALLVAFDGGFSVYVRTMRSTLIPAEHLAKVMGIVGMINLFSIPLGGAFVSTLAGTVPLQSIILYSFIASLVLSVLLLLIGRFVFKYPSYFPSI